MGAVGQLHTTGNAARKFIDAWYYQLTKVLREQMKTSPNGLKPISEKDMPNRRVMLLTDMPAVRFGDDPRTLI